MDLDTIILLEGVLYVAKAVAGMGMREIFIPEKYKSNYDKVALPTALLPTPLDVAYLGCVLALRGRKRPEEAGTAEPEEEKPDAKVYQFDEYKRRSRRV